MGVVLLVVGRGGNEDFLKGGRPIGVEDRDPKGGAGDSGSLGEGVKTGVGTGWIDIGKGLSCWVGPVFFFRWFLFVVGVGAEGVCPVKGAVTTSTSVSLASASPNRISTSSKSGLVSGVANARVAFNADAVIDLGVRGVRRGLVGKARNGGAEKVAGSGLSLERLISPPCGMVGGAWDRGAGGGG